MRIYNGKKANIELPLGNGQKISVGPQSVSGDFLPSTNFLTLIVTSFGYDEIALIVSGIQELNLCASISAAAGFVCHSISEAVERFSKKTDTKTENPALLKEEKKFKKSNKVLKEEKIELPQNDSPVDNQ